MAKKEHKKEHISDTDALTGKLGKAEGWVENNPKIVFSLVGVLLLGVAGYFLFNYYKGNKEVEAQREMFQAVYYFEADSLELALNGDGNQLGFLDIIKEYGVTDAANLSNFYAGAAYLKQGKFELARIYLEDFSASDLLIQARAYSLIGDTYMEEDNFEKAASFYHKASNYKPTEFTSIYLMKEALAYEKLNNKAKALETYQTIIDNYWSSPEAAKAKKYKAILDAKS